MDAERFDEVTRSLTPDTSRRGALRFVAAGGIFSVLASGPQTAHAKKKKRKKKKRKCPTRVTCGPGTCCVCESGGCQFSTRTDDVTAVCESLCASLGGPLVGRATSAPGTGVACTPEEDDCVRILCPAA